MHLQGLGTAGIRALLAVVLLGGAAQTPQQNPLIVFETEKGTIELEVDSVHAPATAANFLKYGRRRPGTADNTVPNR